MTKYISNPENLKLMMNLLRDKSRNIQFEAFHVFKVSLLFMVSPGSDAELFIGRIKDVESLVSESIRNAKFNVELLSRSSRLAWPGISTLERLWNSFDSDAKLSMCQT